MKNTIVIALAGIVLLMASADLAAYSRGICHGYGGRVHMHVHTGPRYHRNDDILVLFMLSSTSTSIYCISIADEEEEEWRSSRRRRYSLINYERLKEEGARGKGEHLAALSYFMGCRADTANDFAVAVQREYATLFTPDFTPDDFLTRLNHIVSSTPNLKAGCAVGPEGVGRL